MLNDVFAGREDPTLLQLAGERELPIALMHMQGEPGTMQRDPRYDDVVGEVRAFLLQRAAAAEQAGVSSDRIVLDPGIGFGKTLEHNLTLLNHLGTFVQTRYPLLLGVSRKGFIGKVSPRTSQTPVDRVGGTCAVSVLAVQAGVSILRVHDVEPNRQAVDVAEAIAKAE